MSGLGKRFMAAGYRLPKPLIPIFGDPMIAYVLRMYEGWDDVIFVVNKNHLSDSDLHLEETLLSLRPKGKVVAIESHDFGPSYAVLKAQEHIALDKPVVVNYCDFAGEFDLEEYELELKTKDATLLTYTGFHPHMLRNTQFAYIQKNESGAVSDIQEKKAFTSNPMSEEASAGSYGFGSGKIMIDAIEKQIKIGNSLNGEFYTSLTIKSILEELGNVSSVLMEKFYQWGTPEDFADFNYWTDSIQRMDRTTSGGAKLAKQATVILAAGKGERVASLASVPKPAIPVRGKQLWQMAYRACNPSAQEVLVVRVETFPFLQVPLRIKAIILESLTKGQADSARIGLESFLDFDHHQVNILASDNVLPDNFSSVVQELMESNSLDIIVWAVKDYPPASLSPSHFSWVKIDSSRVIEVLYKSPPPSHSDDWAVISGNFSFRSKNVAMNLILELLSHEESQINGEYYLDSIITFALRKGISVGVLEIPNYFSLGTVDELQTFNYWSEVLKQNSLLLHKVSDEKS
jgi:NDP-sugar pyrophosphorylase family protein